FPGKHPCKWANGKFLIYDAEKCRLKKQFNKMSNHPLRVFMQQKYNHRHPQCVRNEIHSCRTVVSDADFITLPSPQDVAVDNFDQLFIQHICTYLDALKFPEMEYIIFQVEQCTLPLPGE